MCRFDSDVLHQVFCEQLLYGERLMPKSGGYVMRYAGPGVLFSPFVTHLQSLTNSVPSVQRTTP